MGEIKSIQSRKGGVVAASYLSVGRGLQEAETVSEPLTGQTQLNLLLQDGGSALQNDLVVLLPKDSQAK